MSANDFYFSKATFDYSLSKNPDNSSHMRVEEVLTAEFPNFDQNHGIERCLPTEYRGVKSLDKSSFEAYRGSSRTPSAFDIDASYDPSSKEPFSTYTDGDLTCFRIGSADTYVHGTQVYTLRYNLDNVILAPDNSENQELYWDINGTGWNQPFYDLTAKVHFLDPSLKSAFTGSTSCYVGAYGTSGLAATSRCKTETSSDESTLIFQTQPSGDAIDDGTVLESTKILIPGETMTIDLVFAPDTFYIKKDLSSFITLGAVLLGAIALFIASLRSRSKAKSRNAEKIALAKTQKPVQYTPPEGLTVAEASAVWLTSSSTDSKVATLLELAVTHKIELEKAETTSKFLKIKGHSWKIHIKDLAGAFPEQKNVLEILNGGSSVSPGDVITVKTQDYSSHLARLLKSFDTNVDAVLKSKSLFEDPKDKKFFLLAPKYNKYEKRTLKGIEASNYLDGLKEYISLAEADRLNFLHSVDTVDLSPSGIAKLYERLLPYAIIFGESRSWLEDLNKYYQLPDVNEPDWLMAGTLLSYSDFNDFRSAASSSISSATSSDSSGSSGGGGGGFSGGGGGGGGGGGW